MLTNNQARCSGMYTLGVKNYCPDRDRCLRYRHFIQLDREAGIRHYRGIPVVMAEKNCKIMMEVGDAEKI